jgi:hypothetical protein
VSPLELYPSKEIPNSLTKKSEIGYPYPISNDGAIAGRNLNIGCPLSSTNLNLVELTPVFK